MIYDYRAPKDSPEYANAKTAMYCDCFVDGVKVEHVCYADTDAGVVHVYARREVVAADGSKQKLLYLYRPTFYNPLRVLMDDANDRPLLSAPHCSDIPDGAAYYDLVEPTFGEPVRLRRYGRVEVRAKASA